MNVIENLLLEGSVKTPTISLNAQTGILLLRGRSIPENSIDFFMPIMDWLDQYCLLENKETIFQIRLEYFNTSTSKCILDLLRRLEVFRRTGSNVAVEWYFEVDDEDMEEAGQDYQAIVELPFEMIEVDEI